MTHERKNPSLRRVDRLLRNILKLYNGLYYLNGRQDTFEVFKTLSPAVTEGQVYRGIDTLLQAYALHLSMNVCKKISAWRMPTAGSAKNAIKSWLAAMCLVKAESVGN